MVQSLKGLSGSKNYASHGTVAETSKGSVKCLIGNVLKGTMCTVTQVSV